MNQQIRFMNSAPIKITDCSDDVFEIILKGLKICTLNDPGGKIW